MSRPGGDFDKILSPAFIEVVLVGVELYSIDNRRLWCLKAYLDNGVSQKILYKGSGNVDTDSCTHTQDHTHIRTNKDGDHTYLQTWKVRHARRCFLFLRITILLWIGGVSEV